MSAMQSRASTIPTNFSIGNLHHNGKDRPEAYYS